MAKIKTKDLKKGKSKRDLFSGGGLEEATKRSYDMKDSGGFGPKYLKDGVKSSFWFPKDGKHIIDIIPYLAGENDPNAAAGKPQYVLDVWVHQKVGALQQAFYCPAKNAKKRCPICEKQMEMRKSGDYSDEEIKELNPKRRTMYNIVCYDTKEDIKKGVQLWETAHFFFENHIAEISQRPKTGGFIPFSHPDEGKSIAFKISKKGQNTEYLGHRFEDRDEPIDDDILESALVLDDLLHIPTLAELKQAVIDGFSSDGDEDDEDETPRKKPSKKGKKAADEDEDDDAYEYDEDEDEDEDDLPKKKPVKKGKKVVEEEDEDEDEEEDEDEDERPKKKPAKKPAKKPGRRQ